MNAKTKMAENEKTNEKTKRMHIIMVNKCSSWLSAWRIVAHFALGTNRTLGSISGEDYAAAKPTLSQAPESQ